MGNWLQDVLHAISSWLLAQYYVLVEPALLSRGFAKMGRGDPTYGRDSLPYSVYERSAIYENPEVKVTRRRVYLSRGKPVLEVNVDAPSLPAEHGGRTLDAWVNYYLWEMPEAVARERLNADVYLAHGINDYSGKLIPQALGFMKAGLRAVALDMPSFGRSSGVHAYLPDLLLNAEAIEAVMQHVRFLDEREGVPGARQRKAFGQGSSMGGFTVLYHAALYPPVSPMSLGGPERTNRAFFSGLAVSAPMLQISPQSRPSAFLEFCANLISAIGGGRLPLARAIKGNVSDDPKVEYYAQLDPQVYHGLVRVATGLAVVMGLEHLQVLTPQIRCPVALHHGANDRVTSPEGTRRFYERLQAEPKAFRVWPGVEHAMLKSVPDMSEADVARRDELIQDMTNWFVRLARS